MRITARSPWRSAMCRKSSAAKKRVSKSRSSAKFIQRCRSASRYSIRRAKECGVEGLPADGSNSLFTNCVHKAAEFATCAHKDTGRQHGQCHADQQACSNDQFWLRKCVMEKHDG